MGKNDEVSVTMGGITLRRDGEWVNIERADGAEGRIKFKILKVVHAQHGRRCSKCKSGKMLLKFAGTPLRPYLYCKVCKKSYEPDEDILEKLAARARRAQFN